MDKLFKDLYEFRKFMVCSDLDILATDTDKYYLSAVPQFNDCLREPLSSLIDPEGLFTKNRGFNSTRFFQPEDLPYLEACKRRMDEFYNKEFLTDLIYEVPYESRCFSSGADPVGSLNLIYKKYLSFVSTGIFIDRSSVKRLVSDDTYKYFLDYHTKSSDAYYSNEQEENKILYDSAKNIDRFLRAERSTEDRADFCSLLMTDRISNDSSIECEIISKYDSLKKKFPNNNYIKRYTTKLEKIVRDIQPRDIYLLIKEYVKREYERVPRVFAELNEDSADMLDLLYDNKDRIKQRLISDGLIRYTTIHSIDVFWGLTSL